MVSGPWEGFHALADDWKEADRSIVKGICFCTFLSRELMLADFQADEDDPAQMTG